MSALRQRLKACSLDRASALGHSATYRDAIAVKHTTMNAEDIGQGGRKGEKSVEEWLRRRLNAARADMGMNWEEVSQRLGHLGVQMTASSLMTKHSRASFKAVEYVQILIALGVTKLDLPPEAMAGKK